MNIIKICVLIILLFPINVYAQRGCCSHHGGVSYCGDDGYYICNDYSKSPTCVCDNSENIRIVNSSNENNHNWKAYNVKTSVRVEKDDDLLVKCSLVILGGFFLINIIKKK